MYRLGANNLDLDIFIAQKVFNLTPVNIPDYKNDRQKWILSETRREIPRYSLSMMHAWKALETLKEYEPSIHWDNEHCKWVVSFRKDTRFTSFDEKAAYAVSLAICNLVGAKEKNLD